jgi:hypothetical protein
MEVLLHTEHKCLVMRNSLHFVSPLPRDFDSGLYSLSTSVHGQHHVKSKRLRDKLGESWENIVVESSAAEGQSGSLLCQGFHELWVAMALVDCTVCRKEIEVVFVFLILY